jgi:hypothetical protein
VRAERLVAASAGLRLVQRSAQRAQEQARSPSCPSGSTGQVVRKSAAVKPDDRRVSAGGPASCDGRVPDGAPENDSDFCWFLRALGEQAIVKVVQPVERILRITIGRWNRRRRSAGGRRETDRQGDRGGVSEVPRSSLSRSDGPATQLVWPTPGDPGRATRKPRGSTKGEDSES